MNKNSILDAIGNTPLIKIRNLNRNKNVKIFAKLEYLNPGGSIKDRAALEMILEGERSGKLTAEKTVIEATSGNTGIGLALVCSVKKYRLMLMMSETVSLERQKILKARGAEIVLTPGHLGTDGAIEEVYRLALEKPDKYFMVDQFNSKANWKAHYHGTAEEVWEQTKGEIDTLVATIGTAGTVMGMSRRLKELNPAICIIGVEPYLGHKIQGLKNMKESYTPEIFEKKRLDKIINIDDEEAFEMCRRLAKEEGIFVGMSSGAAMVAAEKIASNINKGTVVVIFPDGGERYLSTDLFRVQDSSGLNLFSPITHRKEKFRPSSEDNKVSIYTCGPTAHSKMHPGEWRRIVFSDLLSRYLTYKGYSVKHVINITDIDDKTIKLSNIADLKLSEFTEKHIESFKKDLKTLKIQKSVVYPKASDHIEDMLELADKIAKKGFAYEKLKSLYFDISRFSDYGCLSGIDLDKIKLGATVDLDNYEKDNPRDFTLLKRSTLSELKRGIFFKSKWGNIRPSWHLQCAAISMKYLKENFDIHTSGLELFFPHNENENAICFAATEKPLAKYWVHCEYVLIDGKKAENDLTLEDLLEKGYTGQEVRACLIFGHYRKAITFSEIHLKEARRSLKRINRCIQSLMSIIEKGEQISAKTEKQLLYDIKNGFVRAMDNDLNVSEATASIFKNARQINGLISNGKINPGFAEKILDELKKINSVLKIFNFSQKKDIDLEIESIIEQRESARSQGNWGLADKLRDRLISMGFKIQDKKVKK